MRFYVSLISVFCLIYYTIAAVYTKKLNSTFILFWPAAGIFLTTLAIGWGGLPLWLRIILNFGICFSNVVILVIGAVIVAAMFQRTQKVPEYMIVLGAQVRGTVITNSLKRRLDKAYQIWEQYPEVKIIVSGGQGKGEDISEADAMEGYLLQNGVPREQIMKECYSKSTRENLLYSKNLMGNIESSTAVVTNNFHIYRAVLYARQSGYVNVWGIAAGTNPVLFLNYFVREIIAVTVIYLNRIKHV